MIRTVSALVALSASAGIAIGVLVTQTVGAQPKPITRIELLNVDLEGLQGKEAHMYTVELAPGVLTPRHWHPGHYFAYVLEGSGYMEEEGKAPIPLQPGTPYYIYSAAQKPAYWHAGRNASQAQPLKMFVVLISDKGQPITNFDK
jgi:quercetin dioxygenase-like cupin family protein